MNKEFWMGKNISVCGGASFIASHTIEKLLRLGANVQSFDDLSSGRRDNLPPHFPLIVGDLRDYKFALQATRHADIVMDFSSVHGGRGFVGTDHEVQISDNFIINTNVVKAAVENGVERIAFSSSACVYDTRKQMDKEEILYIPEHWQNPYDELYSDGMYGLSKAVHEKVLHEYSKDGKIKTAVCRFFTVFGTRMKENHFILASIAKSFIKSDPFYVWGTGREVRNFTPVQNTVQGFLLATEKANGEEYNIGLEERITIDYALQEIWEIMDWYPKEVIYQPEKPVGIRNRVADCTKARKELDWMPVIGFQDGLKETIDWYISTHDEEIVRAKLEGLLTSR